VATATPTKPHSKTIAPSRNPLARWHLLSLDAPTVAALWTWFIAASNQIHLPFVSALAMALAVWILYAADRLMDARTLDTQPHLFADLEPRHYFHHRHRTAFLTGILLVSIALALLLPRLEASAINLYLILGAFVFGYFVLIHVTRSAAAQHIAHRLPKEIAVGICFAAATFIPTVARHPELRLALVPPALLFGALCSLNCLYIYAWEHTHHRRDVHVHPITRLALQHLSLLTTILAASSTALALFDPQSPWTISCAIAIAAILLLLLHHRRLTLDPVTLRAAADLALTTPILLLPFLHR
jgi:hypothetical protein